MAGLVDGAGGGVAGAGAVLLLLLELQRQLGCSVAAASLRFTSVPFGTVIVNTPSDVEDEDAIRCSLAMFRLICFAGFR